jgi:Golgi apparatus protein 1
LLRHLCLTALLLAASANVRGDDACSTEVARLCPKSRGDLLLLSCLRTHEAEISRACKGDADALLATEREIAAECDGDASRLCTGVAPGQGRIVACLQNNESLLSQGCQSAFNEWRLRRMRLTSACAGDIGKLCQSVPEGGGRIWTCLRSHEQELTSDCLSALRRL